MARPREKSTKAESVSNSVPAKSPERCWIDPRGSGALPVYRLLVKGSVERQEPGSLSGAGASQLDSWNSEVFRVSMLKSSTGLAQFGFDPIRTTA